MVFCSRIYVKHFVDVASGSPVENRAKEDEQPLIGAKWAAEFVSQTCQRSTGNSPKARVWWVLPIGISGYTLKARVALPQFQYFMLYCLQTSLSSVGDGGQATLLYDCPALRKAAARYAFRR